MEHYAIESITSVKIMQNHINRLLVGILVLTGCTAVPPKITRFEAPLSIVRGEKAVLIWDVIPTKALQNIVLVGLQDSLPVQGKVEVKPTKPQQYELKIQYKHKRNLVTESRQVNILMEEPPAKFKGTEKMNIGEEAVLIWELPHFVQNVRLSEWGNGQMLEDWNDMPSHANYIVKPKKNVLYKLEYTDEGMLKVLEHKIDVAPAFFTGTRKIIAGEEVQLIWKINPNIKHISLEKRENSYTREILKDYLPATGNHKVIPTKTTEYLLSMVGEHHTTLLHQVEVVNGVITGQKTVKKGEKAFLSWRATATAKRVWIETIENNEPTTLYANLTEEGQMQVNPHGSTQYLLAVETEDGTTKYEHAVRVIEANEAGIYTHASPTSNHYGNTQVHHKGLSSVDDSPLSIQPNTIIAPLSKVLFDFEKTEFSPSYNSQLDVLVTQLKKDESAIAEIVGHADLKGSTKACDRIAKERAESIKKYLVNAGISEYRIITRSFGRMFPTNYEEQSEDTAHENRRAEIVIMK